MLGLGESKFIFQIGERCSGLVEADVWPQMNADAGERRPEITFFVTLCSRAAGSDSALEPVVTGMAGFESGGDFLPRRPGPKTATPAAFMYMAGGFAPDAEGLLNLSQRRAYLAQGRSMSCWAILMAGFG